MTGKDNLASLLKQWGLTQFVALILVLSVLLLRVDKLLANYGSLLVSLVLYCVYVGLLAHARLELTVFRNTKAACKPGEDTCGIAGGWFYFILFLHLVGFLVFALYNLCHYLGLGCQLLSYLP
jgi:hypothetical protein